MASESSNPPSVEFCLLSLWSWLPEGRTRILEALERCNLEQASFAFDEKHDSFQIQCLEDDKEYIMSEYLKAQGEMEDELGDKDVIMGDGILIPAFENDLIDTARPRATIHEGSDDVKAAGRTGRSPTRSDAGKGQQSPRRSAGRHGQQSPTKRVATHSQQSTSKRAAGSGWDEKQNGCMKEDDDAYLF